MAMKDKKMEALRLRKLLKSIDDRLDQLAYEEIMIADAIQRKMSSKSTASVPMTQTKQESVASTSKGTGQSAIPKEVASTSRGHVRSEEVSTSDQLDLDVPSTLLALSKGGRILRRDTDDESDSESWFDAVMNN